MEGKNIVEEAQDSKAVTSYVRHTNWSLVKIEKFIVHCVSRLMGKLLGSHNGTNRGNTFEESQNLYKGDVLDMNDVQDLLNAPNSFDGIPFNSYPLVITFRKFLIMLDRTVGDSHFIRFQKLWRLSCGKRPKDPLSTAAYNFYSIKGRSKEKDEKMKNAKGEYDLADLVIDLHHRLEVIQYTGDEMDFVCVDEVEALTMLQITLLKYLCRNVNSGFVFSTNTAQTIAKGIDFRFQDIRFLFYKEFISRVKINV
ncbi:unnamed protein product [Citrullus colocynthis]|uniref:Uncharacterized protein n=1 Tax=Citrullus colocynthis TaxID=252529 RepID=A0ABP0Z3U7_9ROSI